MTQNCGRLAGARLALATVLLALALVVPNAGAEVPDARAQALALAEDAAVARSRGELDEAIRLMKEALALHTEPGLVYNLGRLYEDAGVLDLAQHHYSRCLSGEVSQAVKERAQKGLDRVAVERRHGRLLLTGLPAGALVSVDDGAPTPVTDSPLRLAAGTRRVTISSPGYLSRSLVVELPGGRLTTKALALVAVAEGHKASDDLTVTSDNVTVDVTEAPTARLAPWGWATLGTGLALVAGGGLAVGLGLEDWASVEASDGWGTSEVTGISKADASARIDSGELKQMVGWALLGVGVAAVGTGVALLLVDDAPSVTVMPTGSATSAGLVLGGAF